VKVVICALIFIPFAQVFAQDTVADWFPAAVGNQWEYEHEVRDSPGDAPHVWRWQTVETITGTLAIPEGLVVLRHVDVKAIRLEAGSTQSMANRTISRETTAPTS
jgi:hypothetical protein